LNAQQGGRRRVIYVPFLAHPNVRDVIRTRAR
jgi:hypothetical protein